MTTPPQGIERELGSVARASRHAMLRLAHTSEIAAHLLALEALEPALDRALEIVASTIALRGAVLIVRDDAGARGSARAVAADGVGPSRTIAWSCEPDDRGVLEPVMSRARELYVYFGGACDDVSFAIAHVRALPAAASEQRRVLAMPLALAGGRTIGVIGLEAGAPLDEADVAFLATIAGLLAAALDRRAAWDRDIAARRDAEARSARYERLIDHLDDVIVWEMDPKTYRASYVSARVELLLGYPRESWLAPPRDWAERVHEEDRAIVERTLRRAAESGQLQRCEHRCFASDGRAIWFHTSVRAVDGRLQGVSVDLTLARLAEERLKKQLDFMRAVALSLGEGVIAVDLAERITFVNAVGAGMLGRSEKSSRGARLGDLVTIQRADGTPVEPPVARVIRTGQLHRGEHLVVRRDGTQFPASWTAAPIRREGAIAGTVLVLEDITERRNAEEAQRCLLEASKILGVDLKYPATLQSLAGMLVPRLGDFCFVDVRIDDGTLERIAWAPREAFEEARTLVDLVGHPAEEVVRRGKVALVSDVDGAVQNEAQRRQFRELGAHTLLMVPMSIGTRNVGVLGLGIAARGRAYGTVEVRLAEELGRRAAYAIENCRLYTNASRDARVREQILGVVSHDLKNPLNTIVLATTLLAETKVLDSERQLFDRTLGTLQRGAARMRRLIDDLLDFASLEAGRLSLELGVIDPVSLLGETLESFAMSAAQREVRLELESDPVVPRLIGDRDRLVQALWNLVGNAVKVSPPGATVTVSARARGPDVLYSVSDGGPGIAKRDLEAIFQRFWRSPDATYRGTGLGLAIARGIVEGHAGRIWAESTKGSGATFYVLLPGIGDRHEETP